MSTSATDRALLLPYPLAVVAFVISQALFDCDFKLTIPSVIMRLQHSLRQRSILSQLVMKRAQINLWPPNFATGSVAWNDTGDQDFYDGSQLTV
jgi:hypothetical protein